MSTYFLVKKQHLKTTIITHASVTEIPLNAACSKQSQKPTSNQNGFRAENAVVTNSHTGFIQQPLLPPPNFSLTKFYMFCKQPVGNGVAEDSPTDDNRFHGTRSWQEDSEWQLLSSQTSESQVFGEGSRCLAWPPELGVLRGTSPKSPGGFSIQHNNS